MDRMGSAWCRKHADELIAEIRRNIKNLGWWRRLQVAAAEGAGIVDIEECFWRAVNPASPETASPQ